MTKKILFISNGHGEDTDTSYAIRALREAVPDLEPLALPLVGEGGAYRGIDVPIVGPTLVLPSGGFTYVQRSKLIGDIRAGLIGNTINQWRAMRSIAPIVDLVFATGDTFSQTFAFGSKRPFISFIASLSALYEGKLNLDPPLRWYFRSPRCRMVITRDSATAIDLKRQGFPRVAYGGMPSMDYLLPGGVDLRVPAGAATIGLLPGSRIPEAERNFRLQLRFAEKAVRLAAEMPGRKVLAFRAALVPSLMSRAVDLATAEGWAMLAKGVLRKKIAKGVTAEIRCYDNAFADILEASTLVVAMAGQAADQALALGKPSLMFPGEGPQFNYRFAEAQYRIHGDLSVLVGDRPADDEILGASARRLIELIGDDAFLAKAAEKGPQQFGSKGSSARIVETVLPILDAVT
ncbi:lipid-A-disaccharide synthase-related protein [Mesorhizobium sp. Z1-4]|uniref:lipid-A-disaccharide synthase-related protein n=1 Tax=Mesorhizobium sp. Z1-4 TaxID=2448478 RepID=UPI000FDB167E|nr:lipid-A-disaccharide synthase-related protein [Mesorhizobium sp. Z1-4]